MTDLCATDAHLGSGELLLAASLREVVRESKARSQRFLLFTVFICLLKMHKLLVVISVALSLFVLFCSPC